MVKGTLAVGFDDVRKAQSNCVPTEIDSTGSLDYGASTLFASVPGMNCLFNCIDELVIVSIEKARTRVGASVKAEQSIGNFATPLCDHSGTVSAGKEPGLR